MEFQSTPFSVWEGRARGARGQIDQIAGKNDSSGSRLLILVAAHDYEVEKRWPKGVELLALERLSRNDG